MSDRLDQQMGDLAWAIATGVMAGYSLREVLEVIPSEAPEPAASACTFLVKKLENGLAVEIALHSWREAFPSGALRRLADTLEQYHSAGYKLAEALNALSQDLLRDYGSDPAFYPAMQREAGQLGAKAPERVLHWKDSMA